MNELTNKTYNYNDYVFFIVFNAMGESLNRVMVILNDLKNCELGRLNDLTTMKKNLFVVGNVTLLCGFLLLAIYLFIIDKHLNLIWELLRTRVKNAFFEIRETIKERVSQVHGKNDFLQNEIDSSILKYSQAYKFRHSLRTLSKISIIFIIAFVFTFIQYYIFEENLQIPLKYHTLLLASVMERKVFISRLGFFVLESDINGTFSELTHSFPFYTGFNWLNNSIEENYNLIIKNLKSSENPEIISLMSPTLKEYVYNSYPSNLTFLTAGTLNAAMYFAQESLFYSFTNIKDNFSNLYQYYTEASALYAALDLTSAMDNTVIADLINQQLSNLYYFTAGFGALFLLMYFCYYYPIFSFDINFLNKLTDLILIIPKNQGKGSYAPLIQKKVRFLSLHKAKS